MPGRDMTGPCGRGARTGRGLGDCNLEDPFESDMSKLYDEFSNDHIEPRQSLGSLLDKLESLCLINLSILNAQEFNPEEGLSVETNVVDYIIKKVERLIKINEDINDIIGKL